MAGVGGEQDAEEYGRFSARIRSQSEPDIPDFTGIKRLSGLGYGIAEFSLVDVSGWSAHYPIISLCKTGGGSLFPDGRLPDWRKRLSEAEEYSLDMRLRLALLLGISVAAQAQDDPKDLLKLVSQKLMDTVDLLPKYVCTLTIDRAEYKSDSVFPPHSCDKLAAENKAGHLKRRLSATDRLRLDVAIGTSHEIFGTSNEMYSWVGDNRFDDRGLFDLVRQGAISTGTFSTLLVSIFREDRASFSYNGDLTVDGRALAEFGFRIPLEKSNYLYLFGKDRRQHVRAPVEGTFLVDSKTLDLVRLTVRHALPPEADACETSQILDYGRVSLGGSDFLLATEARLNILSLADEMENHIVFSACHEFAGQST